MKRFPFASVFREWAEMRRFKALGPDARSIVFYAEDAASWEHFEPIVRELTGPMGRSICYLTSSPTDPILADDREGVRVFSIGEGVVRTALFLCLRADVAVMTMPDLGTYHLKRSMVHPVHYVYVFHSMVSTHMIYRKGAFDHFDTVCCVGPHHLREIRAAETAYDLPAKNLVEHGYGRLDSLLERNDGAGAARRTRDGRKRRVLVAPSWGPNGLLETQGLCLVRVLLDAGHHVTVRPHPMTVRKWPRAIGMLRERFGGHPRFALETNVASAESFEASDVMISDWSGAALEYAFAFERPVLFVDVPRKVNNPDYGDVGCEPLEVAVRHEVGDVVPPRELSRLPARIDGMCAHSGEFVERIRRVRSRVVYNVGRSGAAAAACIARIADLRSIARENLENTSCGVVA